MTQTFTVAGRETFSGPWLVFTGSLFECVRWAERRAFVLRTEQDEPEIIPAPAPDTFPWNTARHA